MDGRGHRSGVEGVADAESRFESPVSDAGFCFLGDQVENCGPCRFAAGAGGCGYGDKGVERFCDGEAAAQGSIDEVEEVCLRKAGVEVHQLCRVDDLE